MIDERESGALQALAKSIDAAFSVQKRGQEIILCSSRSPSRVFLVVAFRDALEDRNVFKLIKHRSVELTRAYKGKRVSDEWIVSFTKSNSESAQSIQDITFENVPDDCEVLKETEVKKVLRDGLGATVTVFRDGIPQLPPEHYDGTATRSWERHAVGVTNWYYDSR